MAGFVWVTGEEALAAHAIVIAAAGGDPGVRDVRLLQSALDRPRNKHVYESVGLPECAAAYAFGIAKNHAFNDGNKRTALAVAILFLGLNGARLRATDREAASAMIAAADGSWDERRLTAWFVERTRR